MKTYLISLFLLYSFNCISCSCYTPNDINEEQYNSYELIMIGEIKKIEVNTWTKTIYVKVIKTYKGNVQNELVKITSPAQSGMCGIFPSVGEKWLFFTTQENNHYHTNLCTRTKNMNPLAYNYDARTLDSDIAYLEKKLR